MKTLFAALSVALFTSVLSTSTDHSTTLTSIITEGTTVSTEGTTVSTESTTVSTESTTVSTESTTVSTESTTVSTETPTVSTEAPTSSTEAPTSSTVAPTSSTVAPTSSTEAPTSSTEAPTSSTVAPTSSTVAPTASPVAPTKEPVPDKCSWNVTEADVTCIRAEMKAQFVIDNEGKKSYMNLKCNATLLRMDCSPNGTQILVLSEKDSYTLTMVFEKESDKFSVRNISLDFTFPDGEQGFAYNDSDKLFSAKIGNSYLCKSNADVQLGNVTMKVSEVHLQAFAEKDTHDFGTAEECNSDDAVSDAIPIAVGVVLVALVLVVLIAYLIGRRRSRQKGYQTFTE